MSSAMASPSTRVALARLVPALDEIALHVRDRRPGKLDIGIVILAFAAVMARRADGMRSRARLPARAG
jgi:hypothetical protein